MTTQTHSKYHGGKTVLNNIYHAPGVVLMFTNLPLWERLSWNITEVCPPGGISMQFWKVHRCHKWRCFQGVHLHMSRYHLLDSTNRLPHHKGFISYFNFRCGSIFCPVQFIHCEVKLNREIVYLNTNE